MRTVPESLNAACKADEIEFRLGRMKIFWIARAEIACRRLQAAVQGQSCCDEGGLVVSRADCRFNGFGAMGFEAGPACAHADAPGKQEKSGQQ
jgi:hypothetical protein